MSFLFCRESSSYGFVVVGCSIIACCFVCGVDVFCVERDSCGIFIYLGVDSMRMLELFSGTGRMAVEFRRRGWTTMTVDAFQDANVMKDVRDLTKEDILEWLGGAPDFIWASPPCTSFSTASMGKHWGGGFRAYVPMTETAKMGVALAQRTKEIIGWFPDVRFVIENPRGVLRKLPVFQGMRRETITYCKYGERRMKPTDIWHNLDSWVPRKMCKNGDACHDAAPRGSKTGTQGLKNAYDRGALPFELCTEIAEVVEKERKVYKELVL